MKIIGPEQSSGHIVSLNATNKNHFINTSSLEDDKKMDFGEVLKGALNSVNDQQQTSSQLNVQSIIDPDSVDPHDVTIQMSKASLSLSMTKAIVDKALQAYRDIINLR